MLTNMKKYYYYSNPTKECKFWSRQMQRMHDKSHLPRELRELILHYLPVLHVIQICQDQGGSIWSNRALARYGIKNCSAGYLVLLKFGSPGPRHKKQVISDNLHSMLQEINGIEATVLTELQAIAKSTETGPQYFALRSSDSTIYQGAYINYVVKAKGRADAFIKVYHHLLQKARINNNPTRPDDGYNLLHEHLSYQFDGIAGGPKFCANPAYQLAWNMMHQFFDNPDDNLPFWGEPYDLLE